MAVKKERVLIQADRDKVLNAHYKNCDSKDEIDHISKVLKHGITNISFKNRGRGPHIGVVSLHELIWSIGRKVNGF